MMGAPFRTDYRLWAVIAFCLFVAFGLVDPLAGAWWKGDISLWHQVGKMVRGEYASGVSGALPSILFYAVLLSVPAILLGWPVEAVVVILRASRQRSTPTIDRKLASGVSAEEGAQADLPRD